MNSSVALVSRITAFALCALAAASVGCAGAEDDGSEPVEQDEGAIVNIPSNYPSDSDWALGRIRSACGLNRAALEDAEGSISRSSSGVLYEAKIDGELVASASARNTTIFAKVTCQSK